MEEILKYELMFVSKKFIAHFWEQNAPAYFKKLLISIPG